MAWFLVALAEIWRWRLKLVLPLIFGALLAMGQVLLTPQHYEARVLLQLQSEQAKAPLLQKITAGGHREALYAMLTKPELLADAGHELGAKIEPRQVSLKIFNDHFMGIGLRSHERQGLEQLLDAVAFNFIQEVLAPERSRIEQLLAQSQQELRATVEQAAAPAGLVTPTVPMAADPTLALRKQQLAAQIVQLQTDLRLVNTAFQRNGSQALLWFAEPATMIAQPPLSWRLSQAAMWGGLLGLLLGWVVMVYPRRRVPGIKNATEAAKACGIPLAGSLPWLGRVESGRSGVVVTAQKKILRPAQFSEVGRIQQALLRGLRGPLVLLGVHGLEGSSLLALLLAEKTATMGKTVALVDLNLKNRDVSHLLQVRGEAWSMPPQDDVAGKKPAKVGKGESLKVWNPLQPVVGIKNLMVLPAPRHPETLNQLGEPGGLARLMDAVGELADVVIVDASPLAAVNRGNVDAMAVAVAGARVALVLQQEHTLADDAKRAADSLLLAGAALHGLVLNQQHVPSRRQLLGDFADVLAKIVPALGAWLRGVVVKVRVD